MSETEKVLRDVIDSDPYHRQFTPLLTIIDELRTALADARRENDAMAAVVEAAEEWELVCNAHWADASWVSRCRAGDKLTAVVRAYRARAKEGA